MSTQHLFIVISQPEAQAGGKKPKAPPILTVSKRETQRERARERNFSQTNSWKSFPVPAVGAAQAKKVWAKTRMKDP